MIVKLVSPDIPYLNDVQEIPRAFFPFLEIRNEAEHYLEWGCEHGENKFSCFINSDLWGKETAELDIFEKDSLLYKKFTKRFLKNKLYKYLSENLQRTLPYGSLTGVRPTKLYYEISKEADNPKEILMREFSVTASRAALIAECVDNQKGYKNDNENNVGIFVNIPFCPTRCTYCSFISTEIGRIRKQLPLYVDCILRELDFVTDWVAKSGKRVTSIYCGGGTPTSIDGDSLDKILRPLSNFNVEFTVEAGRPDCINEEIVSVLHNNKVSRISINPQTFKQSTLELIGRKHTVEDIYRAYELTRDKFDVNMDLIMGLPDEGTDDFRDSLLKAIDLSPQNVTVHALSLKKGSVMTTSGELKSSDGNVLSMSDMAHEILNAHNYKAYYMYRQKNSADNLENVGYCLDKKQCVYNIDMMEESESILAVGAGAMSKIIKDDVIYRQHNPKGFNEYCARLEEIIESKKIFLS